MKPNRKPGLWRRSCRGKNKFSTLAEAKAEARRVSNLAALRFPGRSLSAYQCRFCRKHHIGNQDDYTEGGKVWSLTTTPH